MKATFMNKNALIILLLFAAPSMYGSSNNTFKTIEVTEAENEIKNNSYLYKAAYLLAPELWSQDQINAMKERQKKFDLPIKALISLGYWIPFNLAHQTYHDFDASENRKPLNLHYTRNIDQDSLNDFLSKQKHQNK